jgi:hypothetical protein
MGSPSFDPCLPIPSGPDQLRQQCFGVVGIGFVSLQGRRRARMTGIEADNRKATLLKRMVEPGCQLSGLEPDPLELRSMAAQGRGNRLRLAGPLAASDQPAASSTT